MKVQRGLSNINFLSFLTDVKVLLELSIFKSLVIEVVYFFDNWLFLGDGRRLLLVHLFIVKKWPFVIVFVLTSKEHFRRDYRLVLKTLFLFSLHLAFLDLICVCTCICIFYQPLSRCLLMMFYVLLCLCFLNQLLASHWLS